MSDVKNLVEEDFESKIVIDCPPGAIRPDSYIKEVVKNTGLPEDGLDERITSKFMGEWTWDFSDVGKEVYGKARKKIKKRLTKLYNSGSIRYAEW